jgi:hypothetical protein
MVKGVIRMAVVVVQTFQVKQENHIDTIKAIKKMQEHIREKHEIQIQAVSPISGQDFTFALIGRYNSLADYEQCDDALFSDMEYLKLLKPFITGIVEGTLHTQIYKTL